MKTTEAKSSERHSAIQSGIKNGYSHSRFQTKSRNGSRSYTGLPRYTRELHPTHVDEVLRINDQRRESVAIYFYTSKDTHIISQIRFRCSKFLLSAFKSGLKIFIKLSSLMRCVILHSSLSFKIGHILKPFPHS